MRGAVMKLLVILWAYGILKVVDPTPSQPLYILYDPACRPANGSIIVKATNHGFIGLSTCISIPS